MQLSLVRLSKFDPAAPSEGMPASASPLAVVADYSLFLGDSCNEGRL